METDKKMRIRKNFTNQFYKGNKVMFVLTMFTTLTVSALSLAVSWLLQQIVDNISGATYAMEIKELTLITFAGVLFMIAICGIELFAKPRFMKKAMQQYKEYAFSCLLKKNINSFQKENTATYISAMTNDVKSIEENYLEKTFGLISSIAMFTGAFVMMLKYSLMLTLIVVVLIILPVVVSVLVGNRLQEAELTVSQKNEVFTDTMKESICGFSVIKSFKAEPAIMELFRSSNSGIECAKYKRNRIDIMVASISSVAGLIAQIGVFLAGAYLAQKGDSITPGIVLAFVNLMNYILQPISVIPELLSNRKAAIALIDKMCESLSENCNEDKKLVIKPLESKIQINDLSFAYEKEDVLKDINITLEAGKSYALVGASGSGKSTLLNLLLGTYDNYGGNILYDSCELRDVSRQSLYDVVSVISQNIVIFNASLRDNITMFQDIPREAVDKVIEMAGLVDFVKDHGENYLCGENGSTLSGGEKQRISIARSLLRRSSVLLVDEATAALDKQTAYQVSTSILGIEDTTRIVVTHSLEDSLLRQFDEVIVMKSGQIIEKGTFDELYRQKEYFYSLYTVAM